MIDKPMTLGNLKKLIADFDDDLLVSFHDSGYNHEFSGGISSIEAVGEWCLLEIR